MESLKRHEERSEKSEEIKHVAFKVRFSLVRVNANSDSDLTVIASTDTNVNMHA